MVPARSGAVLLVLICVPVDEGVQVFSAMTAGCKGVCGMELAMIKVGLIEK